MTRRRRGTGGPPALIRQSPTTQPPPPVQGKGKGSPGKTQTFPGSIKALASGQKIGLIAMLGPSGGPGNTMLLHPARYHIVSGSVLTYNTVTRLNFDTKDYDPEGLVTTGSSWAYTTPEAGVYLMLGNWLTPSFQIAYSNSIGVFPYDNGAAGNHVGFMEPVWGGTTSAGFWHFPFHATFYTSANHTLDLRVNQQRTGSADMTVVEGDIFIAKVA